MVKPVISLRAKFFAILLLAIAILWFATAVALHSSANVFRQSHISQMQARLDVADELIEHWQNDHLRNIKSLSELTWVKRWAAGQLALPRGEQLRDQNYAHMRQLYVQQGYQGHVLFDQEHVLLDDANDGVRQQVLIPQQAHAVLNQAAQLGVGISSPYPAPLYLKNSGQAAGTPMYLLCARLTAPSQGSLCLHFDQARGLTHLLNRASHPQYGRLYAQSARSAQRYQGYVEHREQGIATLTRFNPALQRALVLEMPLDALYAPYYLARTVVLSLSVLASLLIVVMVLLSVRYREMFADRKALYRQLLDQLPLQVRVRDLTGRMRLQNQLAADSPYSITANLPLNDAQPLLEPLAKHAWHLQRRVKQQGRVVLEHIVHGTHTDAQFYALLMIGFPIFSPHGKLIALGSMAIDQTEQVRTQHALEHLTQALEQQVSARTAELAEARDVAESAARAKADFLANMSHELRSPLSAVIGLVHLAERSNQDPQVGAYLQRISSSAGHLQEVINDILDFSKIDAGKLKIERTTFDPERLLESVADIIWDKAQRKQLTVLFDIDPRVPKQLYGDPLRLSQILINFADNAIKFTAQGMVAVRIRVLADNAPNWHLCFEVQDSGIGIPSDYLEHIFQPFEQLDHSIARKHGGTGLGLPICRHLAKLMNAELDVRSQPGVGSLFSFSLTLEQVSEQDAKQLQRLNSRRVLLVDAKDASRDSLKAKLEALGLTVQSCASAAQAQALLQEQDPPYQLVIINWDLPDMPAQQLAAHIQQARLAPDSQLMLLSARGTSQLLPPEVLNYFAAVLDTPVSPQRLRETVLRLEQARHKPNFTGRRILLVEDEPINQEVACELLQALGIEVSVAQNGAQALQCLATDARIELVLMDIQMPVLDGLSTMRVLRKQYPHLPVLALTGNGLSGDRERCLAAGMNDYLAKPFQPDELSFLLSRWLPSAASLEQPAAMALLNPTQALERLLGNEALYERLLQRFSSEYQDFAQSLSHTLHTQGSHHAAQRLHSFKSLAATLGAEPLQQLAQQAEAALRHGQCAKTQLEELAHMHAQVLTHIAQYLAKTPA